MEVIDVEEKFYYSVDVQLNSKLLDSEEDGENTQ